MFYVSSLASMIFGTATATEPQSDQHQPPPQQAQLQPPPPAPAANVYRIPTAELVLSAELAAQHSRQQQQQDSSPFRSILESLLQLQEAIAAQLCSNEHLLKQHTLMFSTDLQGRSFPRLVSALKKVNGPTIIVIEEEDAVSSASSGSRSVFGGVCFSKWADVKTRELAAKAANASKLRAERTGNKAELAAAMAATSRPSNQAPQFFGSKECFLFKLDDGHRLAQRSDHEPDGKDEQEQQQQQPFGVSIFTPRTIGSLMNSNFQYFFDVHPAPDLVGLGMGGTGARSAVGAGEAGMAFFVDRSLTRGQAAPGGCVCTFKDAVKLSRAEGADFRVKALEVWAIDPDTIEKDWSFLARQTTQSATAPAAAANVPRVDDDEQNHGGGDVDQGATFSSPALDDRHAAAKMLFQLNGGRIWSENNDRQDL